MAEKSPLPRLDDMREAIAGIEHDVHGLTFEGFLADRRCRWSVERGIEIISEASRHVPEELKARHPEVPWPKVAAIGNVLRHEYMHVAHDAIWAVVQDYLPTLREAVVSMIDWLEGDQRAD